MAGYPQLLTPVGHVAPVPRRLRAILGGVVVVDTLDAIYLWEWSRYPAFYVPLTDCNADALIDEEHERHGKWGTGRRYGLKAGGEERPGVGQAYGADAHEGLDGMIKLEFAALDEWFEEDEQIFVHPRCPYTRVDALRSRRTVRVELEGVVLAECASPVIVFETGLPPRHYLDRTSVNWEHLVHTDTESECPYKGTTSDYWSVRLGDAVHEDLVWAYNFPTRQLQPITGLVAFYDEKVDTFIDGVLQERPQTHFA
jgi:uncharacterized protein (DUF427 family)